MSDERQPASPADRFRRVAGAFTAVADTLAPDDWDRPAPCAGWVARDIVDHLVTWVPAVIGRCGDVPEGWPAVADEPAAAWAALAAWLQSLLDDPDMAARSFDVGPPGEMTVESAIGAIVLGDVLVHTWDLATAAGREVRLDPDVVGDMLAGLRPMDDVLRASGHFGPKVAVPDDADEQTQLVAFTGRDPFWAPDR